MKITGARIAIDATRSYRESFHIHNGRISFSDPVDANDTTLDLTGYLILPGLINAHDHLEFNLFPRLGTGLYPNAKMWAADVYRPYHSPVKEQLLLSKAARLLWGGLKNLLSGVTTVAHHNPCNHLQLDASFPVNVVKQFGWAHSLDFSPDLPARFRATPPNWPFILHAAEGIDEHARSEISRLDALGILSDRTALVHAIGLDHFGVELLRNRRSSLVWCPSSNLSIYGRTLTAPMLRSGLTIALGTDSAMTAQTDLIDEISLARKLSKLDDACIYQMVTTRAARLLRLRNGEGSIRDAGVADLIAMPDNGATPACALQELNPELVITQGRIRLISERLRDRIQTCHEGPLHSVSLEGRGRWFTDVDVPSLQAETIRALGPDYQLAGRRVAA